MAPAPTVVLEFNELTPSLIDRFVAEGHLPNFARFRAESHVYRTMAEEVPPSLEPWIQWVTVHSGVNFDEHEIFHLNEGHKLAVPRTWELVLGAGHPILVCGSMNVAEVRDGRAVMIPDPWSTTVQPNPSEVSPYFRFIQQNVLEHTNESLPLGRQDYLKFCAFMATHGLSGRTVQAVASQLTRERRADVRWQRVVLLDLFQYDVFVHYWRRRRPRFATFFLNSTAHYQHAYWDSMEPQRFPGPSEEERAKYRDAIRFGYQKMDRLLGRIMADRAFASSTIVFCTALSQQPSSDYAEHGGAVFYRPRQFETLVRAFQLSGALAFQPVMSEQFYIEFESGGAAAAARDLLASATIAGEKAIAAKCDGSRVFAGCNVHQDLPADAQLATGGRSVPFFDVFYRMDTAKTGVHHPEGMLWIRETDHRHSVASEPVPLASVAPTLLKLVGVVPPPQMKSPALPIVA